MTRSIVPNYFLFFFLIFIVVGITECEKISSRVYMEELDQQSSEDSPEKSRTRSSFLGIGSIFIVALAGFMGVSFGVSIVSYEVLCNNRYIFFIVQALKFFGIGIVMGTCWCHLLPESFEAFNSKLVSEMGSWGNYGCAYVGLFAMVGTYCVQAIEICSFSRLKKTLKEKKVKLLDVNQEMDETYASSNEKSVKYRKVVENNPSNDPSATSCVSDLVGNSHSHRLMLNEELILRDFGTVILELGILFHSVIIGVNLGIADNEFNALLICLCFHQFFEGIALGPRIGEFKIKENSFLKKVSFSLLFVFSCPIGIAMGIVLYEILEENSIYVLIQGILYSISSGILFYNIYVEFMSQELNFNDLFSSFNYSKKIILMLMMYSGAAAMAVLAIWA